MRKTLRIGIIVLGAVCTAAWFLSAPAPMGAAQVPDHEPDLDNGELIFHAGGCASCHGTLIDGEPSRSSMGGGLVIASALGDFVVPNISSHQTHGIGAWTDAQFLDAMVRGISPDGQHYYPAFPYTSYANISLTDLLDLKAYLEHLPVADLPSAAHALNPLYRWRRPLGLWKRLYHNPRPVLSTPDSENPVARGAYLTEGVGHCGECHTPRNWAQAMDAQRKLWGAPNPEGEGWVPDITPGRSDFAAWSESDIAYYFEAGVDPEFDVVGGSMVAVQENLSRLPASDRIAIAAYLKSLPPSE